MPPSPWLNSSYMLFSTVMEVAFRSFGSVAFWLLLVVVNVTTFPLIKLSSSIVVVIVVRYLNIKSYK